MFWVGFSLVFRLIFNAIVGWLDFITLLLVVIGGAYVYDVIQRYFKNRLTEDSKEKGVLFKKHVIVTGGSSGIGKCLAIIAARQGANVSIIGRDTDRLKLAYDEIVKACKDRTNQKIECLSLDVSRDSLQVQQSIQELEERLGTCYMLINCAGYAVCGKIEDTAELNLRRLLEVNLIGTYFCTKAVVPSMKIAKQGKIILIGSQASLLGIFGYSAYGSSKFAVRGLAESLAMELKPYNVSVTLSLPPDTDTPGLVAETESKPLETKLISASAGLVQPEVVAEQIFKDAMNGKFFSVVGFESFIASTVCSGMSPYSSFFELILQAVLIGPLKIISAFYLYHFDNIIKRCMTERENQKKSE